MQLQLQMNMQRFPRPPVAPPPFNAPAWNAQRPPAPPPATAMGTAAGMVPRPAGAALRATPAVAAAAAATAVAAERDGIETVSVTNVVSAPAINKIGSLFNSLNKTVTGALNSIMTGAPVVPGGAQTQPMSTALSPLPAWRAPPQRPPGVFADHIPMQRVQPPPPQQLHFRPPHQPVVRTISYEQQSVPSAVYWPAYDAHPVYQQVPHEPVRVPADWYSHATPSASSVPVYGGHDQRLATAAAPLSTPAPVPAPHPSAFSRVEPTPGPGDWQSLPDMDRRPAGPPSPVYSNASSTCFIPPTDWSTTRFGSTAPMAPPNQFPGKQLSPAFKILLFYVKHNKLISQ